MNGRVQADQLDESLGRKGPSSCGGEAQSLFPKLCNRPHRRDAEDRRPTTRNGGEHED